MYTLYVYDNQLTSLPSEIGNLANLYTFYVDKNRLSSLPPEIGNLANLKDFRVNDNQLKSLPPEIGTLSNLYTFHVYNNQLGTLPPEIGNLTNLHTFHVYNNQLKTLPPEIGNLSNLSIFYVYSNQLKTLPPEIGNLSNLSIFYAHNNQLSSLPTEIGKLSNLKDFRINNNQLSSLPAEIGTLANLATFYVYSNQLKFLPPEIGKLANNLYEFHVHSNQLGSLPPEIGDLTNLYKFYVYSNQLRILPPEIGNLSNLYTFHVNNNQLKSLPAEIGNLDNLYAFNVHSNQLKTLPPEIGKLANLSEFNVHSNQLKTLPPEIGNLANLKALRIDYNNLSGALPLGLQNNTRMKYFYFSNTKLCEPLDTDFQDWLSGINTLSSTGIKCESKSGQMSLTVTKEGKGTVTSSPAGIDCGADCNEDYASETAITLTATPADGFDFKEWTGNCSGTNATTTITVNSDKTCAAIFAPVECDPASSSCNYAAFGIILDGFGNPMTGATVKVGDKTATTDASGSWTIMDLPAGSYTVTAEKEGHNFRSQSVNLTGDNHNIKIVIEINLVECDIHAEYLVEERLVKIPQLDIPLLNPITQEPTGEFAVATVDLSLIEGADDFKVISDTLEIIEVTTKSSECHANYDYKGILHIPYIDMEDFIVLNDVVIGSVTKTYDVTMHQLPLSPDVFHLESYILK